jgi:hypothetical protein
MQVRYHAKPRNTRRKDSSALTVANKVELTDLPLVLREGAVSSIFDAMLPLFHCPTDLLAGVTFVLTLCQYYKTC